MRVWAPWIAPRHGRGNIDLDKPALLSAFLSPRGYHMVLLGVSGVNDTMVLTESGGGSSVKVHVCHFYHNHRGVC